MVAAPAVNPVTTPDVLIVAIVGAPDVHVPPADVSVSVIDEPTHTLAKPFIVAGVAGIGVILTVSFDDRLLKPE